VNDHMRSAFRFLFLILIFNTSIWANASPSWYSSSANNKTVLNVLLFLSTTCPHCHKADAFFKQIEPTTPWIKVELYFIDKDKNALILFNQLLTAQKMDDFAVPSTFFCNSRWTGFASAETTGKDLLRGLSYCKEKIEKKNQLTESTVSVLRRWGNANLFDSGMVEHPSAARYLTQMALMDALNPCALFCLAAFFSLLIIHTSTRKQIIGGLIFIFGVGVIHYLQQVYAGIFFESLRWLRLPALLAGLFTLYLVKQNYRNDSKNELFILWFFSLALMIQTYQQTCVMNWSYIVQQWLYNQNVTNQMRAVFQLVYQIMYLIPLLLTLILYSLLKKINWFAQLEITLKMSALLILIAIGFILIIYPYVLANLLLSLTLTLILLVLGIILRKTLYLSHE